MNNFLTNLFQVSFFIRNIKKNQQKRKLEKKMKTKPKKNVHFAYLDFPTT